ncbi:hypothetical protein CSV73_10670 [Sporosarcina sp. P1]|nr:hypothetical protein CSV73_10670 [Sporosarcina sp. P1]
MCFFDVYARGETEETHELQYLIIRQTMFPANTKFILYMVRTPILFTIFLTQKLPQQVIATSVAVLLLNQ